MQRARMSVRGALGVAWSTAVAWVTCAVALGPAALAQAYPGGSPPPTVKGERFFKGGTSPRTGLDILLLLVVALAILCLGLALLYAARHSDGQRS